MRYLIVCFLLAVVLAAPAAAGLRQCNSVMVNQTLCADLTQDLLYLRLAGAARANVAAALAESIGWTAQVTCTEAMVGLGQCTAQQLGQLVANPKSERNAAKAEFKRLIKDEFIRSLDSETLRADSKAALDAALAAIGDPDLGN